jgi:hypothetical protein
MGRFKKGERVRVVIEGSVKTYNEAGGVEALYVTTGNGIDTHYVHLGIAGSPMGTVSVESLDPANWPPQVGDIWEAEGREWFAQSSLSRGVVLRGEDTGYAALELDRFKGLNPVLVRRRGQ